RAQEDPPRRASTSAHVCLEADSLLTSELTSEPVLRKVKVPRIGLYDGTSDPDSHLGHYTSWMDLHGASDALRCRMFSLTLGPRAQKWYHSLPPHSIWKWQQLRSAFRSHFIGAQVCLVPKESLANVTQKDDESVKDYIARFNERVQNMEPCRPETLLVMAIAVLTPNSIFRWTLCQNKPNTFQEFLAGAQQHIIAEEAMSVPDFNFNPKSSKSGTDDRKKNKSFDKQNKAQFRGYPLGNANDPEIRAARKQYATDVKSGYQTVYSAGAATIYEEIKGKGILPDPKPLRMPEEKLDKSRYCDYHKSPGHNTDECLSLLAALLRLIGHPQLRKFYRNSDTQKRGAERQIEPYDEDEDEDRGISLPVRFGTAEHVTKLVMETFKVLDINNEYNAIIGRTALYNLRAAVSIFHYALKFPTTCGEGTHYGDQREARELITFIPSTGVHSVNSVDERIPRPLITSDNTISEDPSPDPDVLFTSDPLTEDRGRRPGKEPSQEDDELDPRTQFKEK
ncbi:Unknown protein, partial [Striga hermonthica]